MIPWQPHSVEKLRLPVAAFLEAESDMVQSWTVYEVLLALRSALGVLTPDLQVRAHTEGLWLRMLDEMANGEHHIDASYIENPVVPFSPEFTLIALQCARQITGGDIIFGHLADLIQLPAWVKPILPLLSTSLAYGVVTRHLGAVGLTAFTLNESVPGLAAFQWNPEPELKQIPLTLQETYLQTHRGLLLGILRRIPVWTQRLDEARLRSEAITPQGYMWKVSWNPLQPDRKPAWVLGLALSAFLTVAVLAIIGPQSPLLGLVTVPFLVGIFLDARYRLITAMVEQESQATGVLESQLEASRGENILLREQVTSLTAVNDVMTAMGSKLDRDALASDLVSAITLLMRFDRATVLVVNNEETILKFQASSSPAESPEAQVQLENLSVDLSAANDPVIMAWNRGESVQIEPQVIEPGSPIEALAQLVGHEVFFTVPLRINDKLIGLVIVDNRVTGAPVYLEDRRLLQSVAVNAAIALENARLYSMTDAELADKVLALNIQGQIDRELNETIELDRVFGMTLDWVLRFTNAQVASLALYDAETDELRPMVEYGYQISPADLAAQRIERKGGITRRVARTGKPEIVPDVSRDADYIRVSPHSHSQMSVPVMRDDKVLAVITVESRKLDGFTDKHLEFATSLATRAGVAVDNARLFTVTLREREKLSLILRNIADAVIVIAPDERLVLVNDVAVSLFKLDPGENAGQPFAELFAETPLLAMLRRAILLGKGLVEETTLEEQRTFYVSLTPQEGVGWMFVMHDITPFKEMDQLKSNLISTVSHDLKQPLTVMNGYVELILMQQRLDERTMAYIEMIRRSVRNMRQLVDDLLDLAKIEDGVKLNLKPVQVSDILLDCIEAVKPTAEDKLMKLMVEGLENLPLVQGDAARLRQIFINLVSNAVKYTPPEGWAKVSAETRGEMLLVSVRDNGLGISPEDQSHIFDRFYRVRRPETDSIEGTGLGLAIVKSLVEAHGGQIGLESRLGEGSTFSVMLQTVGDSAVDLMR